MEISNREREFTSQERAMLVAWELSSGAELAVRDVMRLTGLRSRAARRLLSLACRVLPVFKEGRRWRKL